MCLTGLGDQPRATAAGPSNDLQASSSIIVRALNGNSLTGYLIYKAIRFIETRPQCLTSRGLIRLTCRAPDHVYCPRAARQRWVAFLHCASLIHR